MTVPSRPSRRPFVKKSRRRNAEPEAIGDLMGKMMVRIGGEDRSNEQRVFVCYNATVGDLFRRHAEPDALRGKTLFVRVESSALAHEVTLLKREILNRLDGQLGPGVVTDIRTRVAPIALR